MLIDKILQQCLSRVMLDGRSRQFLTTKSVTFMALRSFGICITDTL